MNPPRRRCPHRLAPLALCLVLACAHRGDYVWVDAFDEPSPRGPEYVIDTGDVLGIQVQGPEPLTSRVRVRTDGRISLPYLNDLEAAGRTPSALAEQLRAAMRAFLRNPGVTVTVEESSPLTVSITGEVARPGVYALEPRAGVLHALASAGGLSQFAREDRIFVLRHLAGAAAPTRIRFDYAVLSRAEGRGAAFVLRRSDIILVE